MDIKGLAPVRKDRPLEHILEPEVDKVNTSYWWWMQVSRLQVRMPATAIIAGRLLLTPTHLWSPPMLGVILRLSCFRTRDGNGINENVAWLELKAKSVSEALSSREVWPELCFKFITLVAPMSEFDVAVSPHFCWKTSIPQTRNGLTSSPSSSPRGHVFDSATSGYWTKASGSVALTTPIAQNRLRRHLPTTQGRRCRRPWPRVQEPSVQGRRSGGLEPDVSPLVTGGRGRIRA